MGIRVYQYTLGAAAATADAISFVELASSGTPGAKTRLVYPGSPPALNPITYFTNPDTRSGFDNDDVIVGPRSTLVETLDNQVLVSFERTLKDRVVMENWTNDGGKLAMSTAHYRELRNYHENQPDPEVDGYITWSPANVSTLTFQIQLIELMGGGDSAMPKVSPEFRPIGGGGTVDGQIIAGPDGDLGVEFASAGWQTEAISQVFRLVAVVP